MAHVSARVSARVSKRLMEGRLMEVICRVASEEGKRGRLFYYTDGKMKWKKEVTGRGKEVDRGRRGTLVNEKNETDGS